MIGRFKGVYKRIGQTEILRDVSLEIKKGVTLIVGPNGSGKSSLIKLLVGFWRPTKGEVRLLEEDPWNNHELMRKIGISLDPPSLPRYRRGIEVVKLVADAKEVEVDKNMVRNIFPEVGALNRRILEYSAGMRKRLSLLLALLGDNEVLILDEPFSGLDISGILEVSRIIKEKAEAGTNIVVVSHIWKPLSEIVDEVVVLTGGEVSFVGNKEKGFEFLEKMGI
ncbi:MAG: type transport system ATP-binding protein [Pyrococcus sp.]|uniref:ATP-binding cassette domain-containing protein n=1 Tax=Pyrococcus sp. TaxID=33866 RepID=UPI00258D6718|nr:ABC transporter ATP-binding protein [Pyrococcus sp.]MDK2868914.1 type transport system ATP-binding protein [Pyrococcus sp.]